MNRSFERVFAGGSCIATRPALERSTRAAKPDSLCRPSGGENPRAISAACRKRLSLTKRLCLIGPENWEMGCTPTIFRFFEKA